MRRLSGSSESGQLHRAKDTESMVTQPYNRKCGCCCCSHTASSIVSLQQSGQLAALGATISSPQAFLWHITIHYGTWIPCQAEFLKPKIQLYSCFFFSFLQRQHSNPEKRKQPSSCWCRSIVMRGQGQGLCFHLQVGRTHTLWCAHREQNYWEVCHWGRALEFQKLKPGPTAHSLSLLTPDTEIGALSYLPVTMCPTMRIMD